ncbi:MAG: flagellar assembly protein A [Desulfosoma sp.]
MANEDLAQNRNPNLVFGKLAIQYGLATKDTVRQALERQRALAHEGIRKPLGEVLVEMRVISPHQMKALLRLQHFLLRRDREKPLLAHAVTKGFLLPRDEKRALARQMELFKLEKKFYPIEQVLLEEKLLDPSGIQALKDSFTGQTNRQEAAQPVPEPVSAPAAPDSMVAADRLDFLEEFFDVSVSSDRMEASLLWTKKPPPDVTEQDLHAFVARRGICFGTEPFSEIVRHLLSRPTSKGSIVIARGRPPQPGRNASVLYHFETDPLKVGRIREGGSIDFRDRGEIPLVREGDVLAEKIPPVPGTPGTDVLGNPVAPPKPLDVILRCGRGAVRSEDGTHVLAVRTGRPQVTADGKISVQSELEIPGDVDLKTGHVIFEGDVKISGTVTAGFRVKAASVFAAEIQGGEIIAEGNVMIAGGVIHSTIVAEGHVKARHLAGSIVRACGDVAVSTSVVDSTIETSGSFLAPTATVLSSHVAASQKILVQHVGSEKSKACRIVIGDDPIVRRKSAALRDRIQRLKDHAQRLKNAETRQRKALANAELATGKAVQFQDKTLLEIRRLEEQETGTAQSPSMKAHVEALRQAVHETDLKVEKLFQVQDALKASLKHIVDRRVQCARDLAELEEDLRALMQWATSKRDRPEVTVQGVMAAGTVIVGTQSSWKVADSVRAVRVVEKSVEDPQTGLTQKKISFSPLS